MIFEEATVTVDVSGETTEEDEEEDYIAPALHGEYSGLTGVLPDGTAVLDFSMHPPVSSLVRLDPNKLLTGQTEHDACVMRSAKSSAHLAWVANPIPMKKRDG